MNDRGLRAQQLRFDQALADIRARANRAIAISDVDGLEDALASAGPGSGTLILGGLLSSTLSTDLSQLGNLTSGDL